MKTLKLSMRDDFAERCALIRFDALPPHPRGVPGCDLVALLLPSSDDVAACDLLAMSADR